MFKKYLKYLLIFIFFLKLNIYSTDFIVEKIEINNNLTISKTEILAYLNIKEKDKIEINTLLKLKEKLLNWGYFSKVNINFKKIDNRISIFINVVENPLLKNFFIYVNNHRSYYYQKYITLKTNKAFNPRILDKNIKNLYKLPEISQISYKIADINNNIILYIYITKTIVKTYFIGIFNFLNISAGLEKIDLLFPIDTYISFFYLNKNYSEQNIYFNFLFNIELNNRIYFFTNITIPISNHNITTNITPGMMIKLNKFTFSLNYNYNNNLINFYNKFLFTLNKVIFISKFLTNYNISENNILINNSSICFNEFYLSNMNPVTTQIPSFILPHYSIRGIKTININIPFSINSKYSFNYSTDLIYNFIQFNLINLGIILSSDAIFYHEDSKNNFYITTGLGIYLELGIKNIFLIPIIVEIFTNPIDFTSFSFYFEIKPVKLNK